MKKAPDHLTATARAAWARIVSECEASKLRVDDKHDVFLRYATTFEMWLTCQKQIRREGQVVVVTKAKGRKIRERNCRMADFHALTKAIARIRNELGLGPLSSSSRRTMDETGRQLADDRRPRIRILKQGNDHG